MFISLGNSAFGLFSTELYYQKDSWSEALGGIYCLDTAQGDPQSKPYFQFDSSLISQFILRDTFSFYGLLRPVDLALDTVFLPGFQETDDTGTVYATLPFAIVARVDGTLLKNPTFLIRLGGFIGLESVGTAGTRGDLAIRLLLSISITPWLKWGITGGGNDMNATFVQTGFDIDMGGVHLFPVFDLNGINKTIKLGAAFPVIPSFTLFAGGNYSVDYQSWNISCGFDWTQIPFAGTDARIATSFTYNLAVGITFGLTFGFSFGAQ